MSRRWLSPVLVVGMLAFALVAYPHLPARIPTHFNARGQANQYSGKFFGAFMFPVMALGIWLLIIGLRRVDPRRRNYARFEDAFWIILNMVVALMAVLEVFVLGYALGWPLNMGGLVIGGVGVLFVGLGNYMPRLRPNWWMGIRTPWTLESDRVWRETHRVGGWTFVLGGLVALIAALLPDPLRAYVAVPALGTAALVPVVYSYISWRRGDVAQGES